jgi:hypothetical protein
MSPRAALRILGLVPLALAACAGRPAPGPRVPAPPYDPPGPDHSMSVPPGAAELDAAVALAEAAFPSSNPSCGRADQATLVQAERLYLGDKACVDRRCWRLTFKDRRLVPSGMEDVLGAGGEVYFVVDLTRKQATRVGLGE